MGGGGIADCGMGDCGLIVDCGMQIVELMEIVELNGDCAANLPSPINHQS
jgi:hypothetical protein